MAEFYCIRPTVPPTTTADLDWNNNQSAAAAATLPYYYNYKMQPACYSYVETDNLSLLGGGGVATAHNGLTPLGCHYAHVNGSVSCYTRHRYMPYNHNRVCAAAAASIGPRNHLSASSISPPTIGDSGIVGPSCTNVLNAFQQFAPIYQNSTSLTSASLVAPAMVNSTADCGSLVGAPPTASPSLNNADGSIGDLKMSIARVTAATVPNSSVGSAVTSKPFTTQSQQSYATVTDPSQAVTLQITNLDYSMDEANLTYFLMNQLKPITPVVSLVFEGNSYAKVTVPDLFFAKQVVSNLHRKKVGHKRMLVSYTRDSSTTEVNTLRCQVAGLLKDVPYYTLPMYKFRELFQSRFKTSISVLDLYKMPDICNINTDNEEKFISLQPALVNSLESSPLMEGLQHSVPYCTAHFKREQHKGWAEQEIEPLPNVRMSIAEMEHIICPLLKSHLGDIPVSSLVHCIEGEMGLQIQPNESGVNLEHLVVCVQGIQIQVNNFGIKIIGWLELDKDSGGAGLSALTERGLYSKNSISDPLYQISREVIELVKMSPKSTMKFNRFIPAYHNHFGKQCRVADYGYTKLMELFEALSSVVQIMGDGENRLITLTHRTQIRRFTSDLLRVLRAHGNKSILLSQLPVIFAQTQSRTFDITDYGVCDIVDILDGLVNSNIVVVTSVQKDNDYLISIPKRKQTAGEVEKTSVFAGEMVELFSNAPQYTIPFQKFVRSYHYHFAYQCRLSDYGFLKLADLMEAINGVVQMEQTNDEDKKIFLSPQVARRVFAEQCEELVRNASGSSKACTKLEDVLKLHKKKFGYQVQAQALGFKNMRLAFEHLPYVEVIEKEKSTWIICHNEDGLFRKQCYRACKHLYISSGNGRISKVNVENEVETVSEQNKLITLSDFLVEFNFKYKEDISEHTVKTMKHAIEIFNSNDIKHVRIAPLMKFLMKIVRLLEWRPSIFLHEIKNTLECNTATTFSFGFPNLFTLLSAYPDIFSVNLGVSQERSEISLIPNSEMRLPSYASHQHLYGSLKLQSRKQTQPSMGVFRLPLADCTSSDNLQEPPAKTRVLSNDTITTLPSTLIYKTACNLNDTNNFTYQPIAPVASITFPKKQYHNIPSATCNTNSCNSSTYSTASQQSSLLNSSSSFSLNGGKENSTFNNSLNLFNASFNSSNNSYTSLTDLNNSIGGGGGLVPMGSLQPSPTASLIYPTTTTTKLWDRRQTVFYAQQPGALTPLMLSAGSGTKAMPPPQSLPMHNTESAGLYELVNNIQMCPMYKPPKPDTPPSDDMPYWIDPIWTNQNQATKLSNAPLNIKLPELKSLSVPEMLLSPYSISKNENLKHKGFNFENHDRKIA